MALSNSERQRRHREKAEARTLRYLDAFKEINLALGVRDGDVSKKIRAIIAEVLKD